MRDGPVGRESVEMGRRMEKRKTVGALGGPVVRKGRGVQVQRGEQAGS